MHLTGIIIYPIKSLGGISLTESVVQREGLQYDRRWMLIDAAGRFLTQRQLPGMALLQPAIKNGKMRVTDRSGSAGSVEFELDQTEESPGFSVKIWEDELAARVVGGAVDEWFSHALRTPCQLVRMEENAMRYNLKGKGGSFVSFADSHPFLIIGEASLAALNQRLAVPLPMNRFRPNLVFSGGEAFEEDEWTDFTIGNIPFKMVKPCERCVITTINQETGRKEGAEPLRTLQTFRKADGREVKFGMDAEWTGANGQAIIKVGSEIVRGAF